MTYIHQHELQQRAHALADRLRLALASSEHTEVRGLANRLVLDPGQKPRLVLTGQTNSGKSSLIAALTEGAAQVVIDSAPATDKVEEYDWDGLVTLIDTPGVKAGFVEHDQRAESAITAADLILFVVSVDLFDDTGAEHLRHVLIDLDKGEQTLVVVNKHLSIAAPPDGVRADAVAQAADPAVAPPFTECDAREYLDALDADDPTEAENARFDSQIDRLRAEINELAEQRGQLAQYRQPFQLIRALVDEASASGGEGLDEQAALMVLGRQRAALTQRRESIDASFHERQMDFQRVAQTLAETFADAVEDVDEVGEPQREMLLQRPTEELREGLDDAYKHFRAATVSMLEQQLNDLASEALEIDQGPAAQRLVRLSDRTIDDDVEPPVLVAIAPGRGSMRSGGTRSAHDWLQDALLVNKKFSEFWGAGSGVKASAGTVGHRIVLDVGHRLGKKFASWEAVRLANNIGRVSKAAGPAIQASAAVFEVAAQEKALVQDEKRRFRQRQTLIAEVRRQVESLAFDLRSAVAEVLDPAFRASISETDEAVREIHAQQAARSDLARELASIRYSADEALSLT